MGAEAGRRRSSPRGECLGVLCSIIAGRMIIRSVIIVANRDRRGVAAAGFWRRQQFGFGLATQRERERDARSIIHSTAVAIGGIGHLHPAVFVLPAAKGLLRHVVLLAQVPNRNRVQLGFAGSE